MTRREAVAAKAIEAVLGSRVKCVRYFRSWERRYWDGTEPGNPVKSVFAEMSAHFDVTLEDGRGAYLSPRLKRDYADPAQRRPYRPTRRRAMA